MPPDEGLTSTYDCDHDACTQIVRTKVTTVPSPTPPAARYRGQPDSAQSPTASNPASVSDNAQGASVAPRYDALEIEKTSSERRRGTRAGDAICEPMPARSWPTYSGVRHEWHVVLT